MLNLFKQPVLKPFPSLPGEPALYEPEPLVSVVIDNYNYGAFLKEAIDSALQQSYPNVEVIVVDDGSTDHSREVMASYGDAIIPVYKENGGQASAFNAGAARSRGSIICVLNADDYFHPDKIAQVVRAFQEHPDWVQVGDRWFVVEPASQPIPRVARNTMSQGDVRPLLLTVGRYKKAAPASSLSYRRDALMAVLPVPEKYKKGGVDSYLTTSFAFYGPVGTVSIPLTYYRFHGSNTQARNDDLSERIAQSIIRVDLVNQLIQQFDLNPTIDINQDNDYRTLSTIQRGHFSIAELIDIIRINIRDLLYLRRSLREIISRMIWLSLNLLWPQEGKKLTRLGLRRYLSNFIKPRLKFPRVEGSK